MGMEYTDDFTLTEIKCVKLLPALPLWIIEYSWKWRLTDVLKVLGTPLWLEGDWCSLTLVETCSVRAAAAEAWAVLKARAVEHYERVIEFLEVVQKLLPRLVPCIKHMKVIFGFKTMVIMWMIRMGHCPVSTMEKTKKFFPTQLPQYHRCSRRHMDLMKKNSEEFREFAVFLASNEDSRQAYIRDFMDEQYGEQYAQKLEERLDHYLLQLESALPQVTCLEQIHRREWPVTQREELLLDLLASSPNSLPMALKRLLRCALVNHHSPPNSTSPECSQCIAQGNQSNNGSPITFMHSQQSTKTKVCCQICCTGDQHRKSAQNQPSLSRDPQSARCSADTVSGTRLRVEGRSEDFESPLLLEEENSDEPDWDHSQTEVGEEDLKDLQMEETVQKELVEIEQDKKRWEKEEKGEGMERIREEELGGMEECDESAQGMLESGGRQMCSTHHKWMKSILQECSEELLSQGALVSLTPPLQSHNHTLFSQVGQRGSLSLVGPVSFPTRSSTPKEAGRSQDSPKLGGASPMCMLRISAQTQSLLIRSPLLQPIVLLTRLPPQNRGTRGEEGRGSQSEEEEQGEEEEEEEDEERLLFDVNSLFSDSSHESESDNSDSDYAP